MKVISTSICLCCVIREHSVIAYRKSEILPCIEQIDYLDTLFVSYLIKFSAEPASAELRISCKIASSSLLFYENYFHSLSFSLFYHICNGIIILCRIRVINIIDTDRNYVIVSGFTVSLYRSKLSGINKSFCVLSACSHISYDISTVFHISAKELSPAVL